MRTLSIHIRQMSDTTDEPEEAKRDARVVNAAIERFLAYYVDPAHPLDYAVLIGGPWGSGKTHLVKKFLADTDAKPLYVSLYGMTSVSQIEDEFYRQLHPVLSHPGMKLAGAVSKGLLKAAFKIDLNNDGKEDGTLSPSMPDLDLRTGLDDPRGRLLVFDDLERCRIPVGEVLGFINAYVEHEKLKAIIIANETKVMEGDATYLEIKEKLIGQTLGVLPETQAAFDAFLGLISDQRTRDFLKAHADVVLAVHAEGGRGNLRTLKHAMWDFEKLSQHFAQRHWDAPVSMAKVLKGVLAASMERRAGKMTEDDLTRLVGSTFHRIFRKEASGQTTAADEIDARYKQIDFDDIVLPVAVIGGMLFRGDVDGDAIRAGLDASSDFVQPGEQPLWHRAHHTFFEDDDEADAVATQVEAAFALGSVKDRGELMHLFGVRLWFSTLGLIDRDRQQVVDEGLAYIAALEEAGEIAEIGRSPFDRDNSFFQTRVIDETTPEYRTLANAYVEASNHVRRSKYLSIAHELMRRLLDEPDDVLLDMVINNVRSAPYFDQPVLAALPPEYFVECVLSWPPKIQSQALEILHGRHELRHGDMLTSERAWVTRVEKMLIAALPNLRPMSRERLRAAVARNLTSLHSDTELNELANGPELEEQNSR
ncbi:MAG: KAP family NTPase [Hyphomonas sp.]|nr:KAP family NTPase [Hyphomonas sp.]